MRDILRVMLHINPLNVDNDANQIVDNALATCVHSSIYAMGDILRVMLHINPPNDENNTNQIVDNALATCVYSSRCALNYTMQSPPGALVVFQSNMMMNVPFIDNL